jgi:hypothetical protein
MRSNAIKLAVEKYNEATAKLSPPRSKLDFQKVLDFVHVGEFDLLRQSKHNIGEKPWSKPALREATNAYHKVARATEELTRIRIEAHRLLDYIVKSEVSLRNQIQKHSQLTSSILSMIQDRYHKIKCANEVHLKRLFSLASLDGFDGTDLYKSLTDTINAITPQIDMQTIPQACTEEANEQEVDAAIFSTVSLLTGSLGVDI